MPTTLLLAHPDLKIQRQLCNNRVLLIALLTIAWPQWWKFVEKDQLGSKFLLKIKPQKNIDLTFDKFSF